MESRWSPDASRVVGVSERELSSRRSRDSVENQSLPREDTQLPPPVITTKVSPVIRRVTRTIRTFNTNTPFLAGVRDDV